MRSTPSACLPRAPSSDHRPKKQSDLLFTNQKSGAPLSDRIWADGLKEMLVESGLATWSDDDSNDCRKIDVEPGNPDLVFVPPHLDHLPWSVAFRSPTVCNCDTPSIHAVQEHYFHYDAKRATDALSTGRKRALKGALSTDWMRDPYVQDGGK